MRTGPGAWVGAATLAVLAAAVAPHARGQEGTSKAAPERGERALLERWKREAAGYSIVAHAEPEETLTLKDEPALRWTNPVRNTDGGLVFVWTAHGRPEAVSCFYRVRWEGRLVEAHEFLSLARVGLTGTREGRTVWSPQGAGVDPRPIPGAPKPAASPAERLRQMRGLAHEFKASVDTDAGPTELRMLSQPVYRFEAAGAARDRALPRRHPVRVRPDDRPRSLAADRGAARRVRPRMALLVRPHDQPQRLGQAPRPDRLGGRARPGRRQPRQAVLLALGRRAEALNGPPPRRPGGRVGAEIRRTP